MDTRERLINNLTWQVMFAKSKAEGTPISSMLDKVNVEKQGNSYCVINDGFYRISVYWRYDENNDEVIRKLKKRLNELYSKEIFRDIDDLKKKIEKAHKIF